MDEPYSAAALKGASDYVNQDFISDAMTNSRAIAADQRQAEMYAWQANINSQEAAKNRQWQENMSNTAYRRQAADLAALGFSPLAALGGSGASTPSGASASVGGSSTHSGTTNALPSLIGTLIGAGAMIASKGMTLGVQSATATAAEATKNKETSKLITALTKGNLNKSETGAVLSQLSKNDRLGEALEGVSAYKVREQKKAQRRALLNHKKELYKAKKDAASEDFEDFMAFLDSMM